MKKLLFFTLLFVSAAMVYAEGKFSVKDITSGVFSPKYISGLKSLPGGDMYAKISDDGEKIVSYHYKNGQQAAILFDIKNTIGEHISSFDGYILSPDGSKMLIRTETKQVYRRSTRATYYVYNIASRRLSPLSSEGNIQNPVWSNDGNLVAFVRDNNIHLVKLLYDGAESQITKDGEINKVINGIPDWVNEEEFSTSSSLCFNADGTMVCWVKYREDNVKQYSLQMFKGSNPAKEENRLYPSLYTYKYPKAGEDNAVVSAWSYDIKSHVTRKMEIPLESDSYIPRIIPTSDANKVLIVTLNRRQDALKVYSVNPRSAISQVIIEQKAEKYIKEDVYCKMTVTPQYILMPDDKGENVSVNVYSQIGSLRRSISLKGCDITQIYGIEEKTGDVYFQAASPTPADRQVFVSHANGKVDCLTPQQGTSSAQFSSSYQYFLKTWSNADNPFVFSLCNSQGKGIKTMEDNKDLKAKLASYPVTGKEFFTFSTSEGVKLQGWMIKPADFNPSRKYPVIMYQYGGPGSQQVVNSWNIGSMGQGGMFDYYLAENGFIVVCVDGRGTGCRGNDFEKCTYLHIGELESKDQVETALWLGRQSYIDKDRIGIWGWSFGGFNTLMAMSDGNKVFACGVSVAPPTDLRFYDTVYTERYMRTPQENADGYSVNPISRVNALSGALLLCHGLADDNVHPQNLFEYTDALVNADKDFKELVYTNRNHSIIGGNSRNHLLRQIAQWFFTNLK